MSIAPLTNATATRNMFQGSVRNFRMLTSATSRSRQTAAQHFAHGSDKMQRTLVAHGIIHVIGFLSRTEDAFFPEDRQVLRDVALRSPDRLDDVLHAQFVLAQNAQNLQPQRMRNGPHCAGHPLDLLLAAEQLENVPRFALQALPSNFHMGSL